MSSQVLPHGAACARSTSCAWLRSAALGCWPSFLLWREGVHAEGPCAWPGGQAPGRGCLPSFYMPVAPILPFYFPPAAIFLPSTCLLPFPSFLFSSSRYLPFGYMRVAPLAVRPSSSAGPSPGYRLDSESPAALRPQWDRRAQQRVAKTAGASKQALVRVSRETYSAPAWLGAMVVV